MPGMAGGSSGGTEGPRALLWAVWRSTERHKGDATSPRKRTHKEEHRCCPGKRLPLLQWERVGGRLALGKSSSALHSTCQGTKRKILLAWRARNRVKPPDFQCCATGNCPMPLPTGLPWHHRHRRAARAEHTKNLGATAAYSSASLALSWSPFLIICMNSSKSISPSPSWSTSAISFSISSFSRPKASSSLVMLPPLNTAASSSLVIFPFPSKSKTRKAAQHTSSCSYFFRSIVAARNSV
mmetsp:Transcript_22875/g.51736  ORF Transcript_22875/g.51736 Transcript_22875/m.51736 type:complete len:240 (-) Transcript_22875:828-1547(-)